MNKNIDLDELFKNPDNLKLALTHRSYLNEHKEAPQSNERLEFLGDSILSFVVSKYLYDKYPDIPEGQLTALRTKLVQTATLARLSRELNVGVRLLMSKGEEASGGRNNQSLLANTYEAILGALLLDGGISNAKEFVKITLLDDIDRLLAESPLDSKSAFQEKVQALGHASPIYETISADGPDHAKTFTICVKVDGNLMGTGKGKSKQEAEQNAAAEGLRKV